MDTLLSSARTGPQEGRHSLLIPSQKLHAGHKRVVHCVQSGPARALTLKHVQKVEYPGNRSSALTTSQRPIAVRAAEASAIPLGPVHVHGSLGAILAGAASKVLGYLVICGSLFLKVPQIARILKNRSVAGLNTLTFELECVGYTMALAYCITKGVPFFVYGELFFILAQSLVLLSLLYIHSPWTEGKTIKAAAYVVITAVLFTNHLPSDLLEVMYNLQTSMFTIARLPQIWTNFRESSTGELSLTSSLLSVAGCLARLYTSLYEHAPRSMVISSISGFFTHGFLLLQILLYWPKPK